MPGELYIQEEINAKTTDEDRPEPSGLSGYTQKEHDQNTPVTAPIHHHVAIKPTTHIRSTHHKTHKKTIKTNEATLATNKDTQLEANIERPMSIIDYFGVLLAITGSVLFSVILFFLFRMMLKYWLTRFGNFISSLVSSVLSVLYKFFEPIRLLLFFVQRGKLTARASTYLIALEQPDATQLFANKLALSIDTYAAKELLPGTIYHLNEVFNGNKLALISEARLRGFIG